MVQIKNSCFWKIKANCASVGLPSFSGGISLRQPVWSFTPIAIFCENFLFVDYRHFNQSCSDFPPQNEKKKQNKTKRKNERKKFANSQKPKYICSSLLCVVLSWCISIKLLFLSSPCSYYIMHSTYI